MPNIACCGNDAASQLKVDGLVAWLEAEWMPTRVDQHLVTLNTTVAIIDDTVIAKFDRAFPLPGGYAFSGIRDIECPIVARVTNLSFDGDRVDRSGAFLYQFTRDGEAVDVLALASYYTDEVNSWRMVCVASVPQDFIAAWHAFARECDRLHSALDPTPRVIIIGGRSHSFVPTVNWDEIVLPEKLKSDILGDVSSFFLKGIDVYKRLNLKPFRKLLLAGVPGTGKTMLCSALARWALERQYVVIYVSSAYKGPNDEYGSTFSKIQHALSVAASSNHPSLILLEELDAFLHEEEKAIVLNVLDGNESSINDKGTLLIATTNYPEAIDERVLKRPGRLDRVFIVPETRTQLDAEHMLRQYLGIMWQEAHRALVPALVGYPGAFIREVAVYALTQVAYDDMPELSYAVLEQSYQNLKEQLEARDDFLKQRNGEPVLGNGYSAN